MSPVTPDPESCLAPAELAAWCSGDWRPAQPPSVRGVSNDTRTLDPGSLYVALRGENFDGHDFVRRAFAQGAAGAVVCRDWADDRPAGADVPGPLLCVEDSGEALRAMAHGYRLKVAPLVIAVTGSAGKSTVKEMAAAILSARHPTACTRGNWNNEIGLPLSMLSMAPSTRVGVFEVGMSHPGEISDLCRVLQPAWGVVTNVGPVHAEFFGSVAEIALEKSQVLACLPPDGLAVLNRDDAFFSLLEGATPARVLTVSSRDEADYTCVGRAPDRCEATIRERASGETCTVRLPVPGEHNVANALLAIAVGRAHGAEWEEIRSALLRYKALPMRWQEQHIGSLRVINDGYNANPLSMRAAIDAFREDTTPGRKWLVLADMLELGAIEGQAHLDLGRFLGHTDWQGLITVGALGSLIGDGAEQAGLAPAAVFRCRGNGEAAQVLAAQTQPGDAVLLKGSRGMALEEVVSALTNAGEE